MKTKLILPVALLAFASSASAITASLNDLVLGFSASGGTGSGVNLEVNLGNVSQFYNPSGKITLTGLNVGDLVGTYGVSWNTRTDLSWGIVGTTGAAFGTTINSNSILASTLWGTKVESTLGVQSTPWTLQVTQSTPAGAISALYSGQSGSLVNATATTNSATAAVVDNSLVGSYGKQFGTTAAAFGKFNPKASFVNSTDIASGSFVASDLYEIQPGSGNGTFLGTFALSSDGVLTYGANYAAATVPEPATYTVLLGVAALGYGTWHRRRRLKT